MCYFTYKSKNYTAECDILQLPELLIFLIINLSSLILFILKKICYLHINLVLIKAE